MKLTIGEKAKAYDEAYEKVAVRFGSNVADEIFIEESEDEKIRKELIDFIYDKTDTYELREKSNSWLAWLEKQGEQKPVTDEVKPKFKIGDWIISHYDNVAYIESISGTKYNLRCKDGCHGKLDIDYINKNWRLWTIKDAKDGDVLATLNHILIFEAIISKDGGVSYCHYDFGSSTPQFDFNKDDNWYFGKEAKVYPATKEQRDLLFQKMKDDGYEWDADKKELKKAEQKPAWSEEDEEIIHCLEYTVRHFYEDEDTINRCCGWLKSLIPQNTWKPTEEQIRRLEYFVKLWGKTEDTENTKVFETVKSLLNDLKQL